VCARDGSGIVEMAGAADAFLAWSCETGRQDLRLAERLRAQILRATQERLMELCLSTAEGRAVALDPLIGRVASGTASPREAADQLIEHLLRRHG
jgi:putative protein kinase ArgK-like GTPase of G3E family